MFLVTLLALIPAGTEAQTLADIAARERARQKNQAPAKIYGDDDLRLHSRPEPQSGEEGGEAEPEEPMTDEEAAARALTKAMQRREVERMRDLSVLAQQSSQTPVPVAALQDTAPMEAASRVQSLRWERQKDDLVVTIQANGRLQYRTFELKSPDRLVIDLADVDNGIAEQSFSIGGEPLRSIRVVLFRPRPQQATRVVLDLSRPARYEVSERPDGLTLVLPADAIRD